jgi:indole-3-glycerol phosphate synthase
MSAGAGSVAADFLARMAAASRRRLESAAARTSERELLKRAAAAPRPPALRLAAAGFDVIAELKRRSPSAGPLADASLDPSAQARSYAAGGACALSVLTEPEEFAGALEHVAEIAALLPGVPVMRKDFLVGRYQVLEARVAGAAGVLLIAAMLDPEALEAMTAFALELGLFVLVEIFDQADLARCAPVLDLAAGTAQLLLGVNCRDLRTLQVRYERFAALAPALPRGVPWVAESGIETPAQAAELAGLGYRVGLVGTALMRSGGPAEALRALIAAGRAAGRPQRSPGG